MKLIALTLSLLGVSAGVLVPAQSAVAADPTDGISPSMAVGRIICEKRYVHTPDADVAYQPGVDVNGNDVVGADLNETPIAVPDYIEVPLTVELSKAFNISLNEGGELKSVVGSLKLFKTGKVEFNGVDVTAQAEKFCGRELVEHTGEPEIYRVPEPAKPPVAGSVANSVTIEPPKPMPLFEIPKNGVSNMKR